MDLFQSKIPIFVFFLSYVSLLYCPGPTELFFVPENFICLAGSSDNINTPFLLYSYPKSIPFEGIDNILLVENGS